MYRGTDYVGRRGAAIHAISALDIALWDIAGQFYGVPLRTLLGGKHRDRIAAYGTFLPRNDDAGNRQLVNGLLEQGFRSLKVGGGTFGDNPIKDKSIIRVLREEVGNDIQLQIDLVGRWRNYTYALEQCEALREFNLNWIEEPLPSDETLGLARLARTTGIRVAGGEGLATRHEFQQFLDDTAPAIIQPDITRCGGITEMRHIYELARTRGVQLVPHGFSTGILLAATAHFLASTETGDLIEYSQSESPLFRRLVKNLLPFRGGYVQVPDAPGLGLVLDEEVLEQYRVRQ
ncbi:mandelate racemase/muconate lactonizing enzyme family protein [Paraburkholderia sp. SIMBA_030]|uniref:mandelate racemase/muconate lactonizing enzyme family protein n=1 Tax=Paraburkholderia sp. SIMBA_030 TaxID=3085773 RepID=UPI00397E15B9